MPLNSSPPTDPAAHSAHRLVISTLAGLLMVCVLIVVVGSLLLKSPPPLEARPAPMAEPTFQTNRSTAAPVVDSPASIPEPEVPDDPRVPETPRLLARLERRSPTLLSDTPRLPADEPAQVTAEAEQNSPGAVAEDPTASRYPLQWSLERSGSDASPGQMLILPIEIARIDNDPLPHSIRRLKFPDAAVKQLRLAVTPSSYDDIAVLLTALGEGYRHTKIRNEDLYSLDTIKDFDVLFLTCARMKPADVQAVVPLRKFVERGGTLYASDLRCELLLRVFPEFRAIAPIYPGVPQNIIANVTEPGLQSYLGRRIVPLNLESPDWWPAAFEPSKVTVCMRGFYRNTLGQSWQIPLMVKFPVQKGTVIFTAFHNAKNDSDIMRKLLQYQVFSSVNARSEARVKELMQRSRFAPQDLRTILLTQNKNVEATYQHKAGGLQIAVGFEHLGARLKLTLQSPAGKKIEHEGDGLYLIEIPAAEPGEWRYTITPVELPYPNFPVMTAVGMGKS